MRNQRWFHLLDFLLTASRLYLWSCIKNIVKLLLGRKIYFSNQDLFFRQYLFQIAGIRPIKALTCMGLNREGAGSQALMMMHAMNFARCNGLRYEHTPFTHMAWAQRPQREWAAAWEEQFNLGAGEPTWNGDRCHTVDFSVNDYAVHLCFGRMRHDWLFHDDEEERHFRIMIPEFRAKYYSNKKPRITKEITVAVHVRRGDVVPGHWLYTSTPTIACTMAQVISVLDSKGVAYVINVFSHGAPAADFATLSALGARLWLDADGVWVMGELIEADILIMAKGTFSHCAALISDGIKICEPEGGRVLDDWIVRAADGSIDRSKFEDQFNDLIRAKMDQPTPVSTEQVATVVAFETRTEEVSQRFDER